MPDLTGKVCIVTGSTRGIGKCIAEACAAAGAHVVVSARGEKEVAAIAAALESRGRGGSLGVVCDVRRPEQCERLIARTVERFGRVDVLVNNAGYGLFAPVDEMPVEEWQGQIETNLGGVFYCVRAVAPHMKRGGGGWIINIGSLAGRNPFAGGSAYNASKFGLVGMTEAMMLDLRYDKIRISIIMPGSVNTEFRGKEAGPQNDWMLQPEDVAQVVLDLLALPENAHVSRVEMRPSRPPRK
ncbi:MAG: SDR family oxidoreductase [Gemmatimonadetes bacterium]|nr:SDR family oxidoreductase [Gemmatimonadota bacterium]